MGELSERERAAYAAVDDALHTYPMQPAPEGILLAVRARLQPRQAAPRFYLSWLDCAIGLFVAGMVGLTWGLWPLLPLPVDWPARVQFRLLVWGQYLRYGGAVCDVGLALGVLVGALAVLAAWRVVRGASWLET